jgi:two-component system response regulator PhcR
MSRGPGKSRLTAIAGSSDLRGKIIRISEIKMQSQQPEQVKWDETAPPAVLYVDDEPQSIKYFARAFERDFRVLTAANADAAEELLASGSDQVGVLITDQRMPLKTGVQLLDRVKALYPDIVRILTTAYADLDDAVAAVNRGEIFRYILKPWDIKALRAEIHNALELYRRKRYERDLLQARRRTIISLASHIAHELSTPLATIHTAVSSIDRYLSDLVQSYRREAETGRANTIPEPMLELMINTPEMVLSLVDRTNMLIRLLLMNAAEDAEDRSGYCLFSVRQCVDNALRTYPFRESEETLVRVEGNGFEIFGSDLLLSYVIYNLLKNALDAVKEGRTGEIRIRLEPGDIHHRLFFRDTGTGISPQILPHIFDEFYSSKGAGHGTGMGLPFCRRVLNAFDGDIQCRSRLGEFTELELTFPVIEEERKE